MELVRATELGHVFADGEVATVEVAEVIGPHAKCARDTYDQFGRGFQGRLFGGGDLDAGIRETEWRARARSPPLPVQPKGRRKQQRRPDCVSVVYGDILHANDVAGAGGCQQIFLRDHSGALIVREEVTAADLML